LRLQFRKTALVVEPEAQAASAGFSDMTLP
jgi:hypothetical protein